MTRRDAVARKRVAAKELFWDALLHASVGEVQMLSEEEGMDKNGFIPESERLKIAKELIDGLWRTGTITIRKVGRRKGWIGISARKNFHVDIGKLYPC